MKCAELIEEAPEALGEQQNDLNAGAIRLPEGLLGFEKVKDYLLLSNPEEAPFLWLKMEADPNLAFVVVEPSLAVPDYRPEVQDDDAKSLEIQDPTEAMLLNIVTVHRDGTATVNLKGPIVVNRRTGLGKQVIPLNAAEFQLQHPLTAVSR